MNALRLSLAGLAVLILLVLGGRPVLDAWRSAPASIALRGVNASATAPDRARDLRAQLSASPDYSAFFREYAAAFPADYAALLQHFADQSPVVGPPRTPDFYMSEAISALRRTRGLLASRAEPPALARIFDVQQEVMSALAQADARLCVQFLYGDATAGFERFSAGHRKLLADMGEAALAAILNGQEKRINRAAPSEAEFQQLETELVSRGLTESEISALLDGRTPDPPITDARMCAAGIAYLDALRALPEETRTKIYALAVELMARS